MDMISDIQITRTTRSRLGDVNFDKLEFGKYVSDHMLVCDYAGGGWQDPKIVPFANLSLSPTTLALHYGQTVFEGMKAIHMQDGRINLFRLDKHYERLVRSLERMCMAVPSKEIFIDGLIKLVGLDRAWVPKQPGTSLYIRPFEYASEARFGVKVSDEYRFIIFTGPVPSLYAKPIRVIVETNYVRASRGGTGFAKCGGNYGGAFYPTQLAREKGYDQVLWTDGIENRFIEESGMMNVFFVINHRLLTAPLSDSILDGVTRDSLLTLAQDHGFKIEESLVSIDELKDAFANKSITEAFGAGTAALVVPIETIQIHNEDFHLPPYNNNSLFNRLKHHLEGIRNGTHPDTHRWNFVV